MTAVIVGHGRSPVGQRWGGFIDKAETVVRMWDCHWQPAIDYGVKYDYGYTEVSPRQWERFEKYNIRTPTRGWVAGQLKRKFHPVLPTPSTVISPWPWVNLGVELGGAGVRGKLTLTRGVVTACWVLEGLEPAPVYVVLVGFDNVRAKSALSKEEGFPAIYADLPSTGPFKEYVAGSTKYHNHDYAVEERVLRAVSERRNIKFVYAEDIWP